jgi:modification methylase
MQIEIYNKDSTKDMSEIRTASIDMIITSPPYWKLVDYNHPNQLGVGLTYRHYIENLKKNLLECMRVLKEDGFAAFIVGDVRQKSKERDKYARPRLFSIQSDIIQYFISMDFELYQHFIWRKMGINKPRGIIFGARGKGENSKLFAPPICSDLLIEHIIIFRKPGKKRILSPINDYILDEDNQIILNELQNWVDPVWVIDSPMSKDHPATLAPEVVHRLVKMYSLKNDYILDPFCGIGTTLNVGLSLKRNVVGYELNKDYIDKLSRHIKLEIDGYKYFAHVDNLPNIN